MNQVSNHPAPSNTGALSRIIPQPALSKRAKAAIVVRLLINEGADIALEELPPELQAQLTQQMGMMRVVDRVTLAAVVEEFTDALDSIGLSFPGGIAGALDALEGRISRETAKRLRKEAGVRAKGDPWKRLLGLPEEDLQAIIARESTEVAAVLLSKLDIKMAAGLLGAMSGPEARRITYAVSLTSDVSPDAVDRIGLSLAAQLDDRRLPAFDTGPAQRLGAILNAASSPTRDEVLTGLHENDEVLAKAVRKAIFTFGDIATRIAPRDIPRILREVDNALLITAMAGAQDAGYAASHDFILESMSGRMADQLREDINDAGKVKMPDADAAMSAVVAAIREMEERGDLVCIQQEDSDNEV